MANRAVMIHHILRAPALVHRLPQRSTFQKPHFSDKNNALLCHHPRCSSTKAHSSLEPPDVLHLAQTARISLTPQQAEEYAPKIGQVIDWFGQLQDVDQTIEPAIRADTDVDNIREDVPELFENREAMISAVPSYEEPYIKVPKVLNKE